MITVLTREWPSHCKSGNSRCQLRSAAAKNVRRIKRRGCDIHIYIYAQALHVHGLIGQKVIIVCISTQMHCYCEDKKARLWHTHLFIYMPKPCMSMFDWTERYNGMHIDSICYSYRRRKCMSLVKKRVEVGGSRTIGRMAFLYYRSTIWKCLGWTEKMTAWIS